MPTPTAHPEVTREDAAPAARPASEPADVNSWGRRYGPEVQLLLLCSRVEPQPERRAAITDLLHHVEGGTQPSDWEKFLNLARPHGVLPLVFHTLSALAPKLVPSEILAEMRAHSGRVAQRNMTLTFELLRLLKLFREHDIIAIPYKGPLLATTVYGGLGLRAFNDLDVLVSKRDVPRAREIMTREGYEADLPHTRWPDAVRLRFHYEYNFVHPTKHITVDLQWGIPPSHALDVARFGDRWHEASLAGTKLSTFSPEDLLLILAVHGTKHLWVRLDWICGIAELLRSTPSLRWNEVLEQARQTGRLRMLFLALLLARDLLDTPLPPDVLRRVKADASLSGLRRQVLSRLFPPSGPPSSGTESALESGNFGFHLRARERSIDKIGHAFQTAVLPNEGDCEVVDLPPVLFPLYYAVRPLRLAAKFGAGMMGRVTRRR